MRYCDSATQHDSAAAGRTLWVPGWHLLRLLGALVVTLLPLACSDSSDDETSTEEGASAEPTVRFIGTAAGSDRDFDTVLPYFGQVTPEDAGKWGTVEVERGVMDWTGLDRAYQFARTNGLVFKFHAFVWGQQEPPWIAALPPAEQLAELDEWMALVAERYPDLELLDVVNEPLHEMPSYGEALGGTGTTGWDWVIKSFEMARAYFPNGKLLINDYNILMHENFTTDYLEPITILLDRGLVDGIGIQAHNLEKAEAPVVASNLSRLGATGLPLYISEFDLDIVNDALHAQRFAAMFTTFWNEPAVAGVTHWGHIQGDIWRQNGYLIRADGTLRPAMEWWQCTLAGMPTCPLPEYVPSPRVGTETGLTVEAEDYDSTSGVLALGSIIGYTDMGDWVGYRAVEFQDTWDSVSITYSAGNSSTGSASFHLGTLESSPVLTVDFPPTGGWGTSSVVTAAWPAVSGMQDLYVTFHDADGVGNFDKFRFGEPPPMSDGSNLVVGGDFEVDAGSWFSWDGVIGVTDQNAYEGNQSLVVTNRADNGPAAYDLTGRVTPGGTYSVSMAVDISGDMPQSVNITKKEVCPGEEDEYAWVINPVTVTPGTWVELAGSFTVKECELTEFLIFAEGPPGGVDIYIDNVVVE